MTEHAMKKIQDIASKLAAAAFGCTQLLAVAAEAPAQKPLDFAYSWSDREVSSPAQYADTCPVHVVLTEDERQNKETIGQSMGKPLLSGDMSRWVADGLGNLKGFGFKVDEVDSAGPPTQGITVRTSLTRAYTWQVGLKIFSMVALRARFIDKNGVLQEKYYRAHGDKANIWGADAEHVTTMNYGLNNLLPVMASDLASLCKGSKVEAYSYAGPEPVQKK
jgi:hypothetical protein